MVWGEKFIALNKKHKYDSTTSAGFNNDNIADDTIEITLVVKWRCGRPPGSKTPQKSDSDVDLYTSDGGGAMTSQSRQRFTSQVAMNFSGAWIKKSSLGCIQNE